MIDAAEAPLSHPEEMRASFDFQIGNSINMNGTARTTPAGIISVGIAVAAILTATAILVRAARHEHQKVP